MRIINPVDNIILRYKNLVWKCSKGLKLPPYITEEDIIQEGYYGLLKAYSRFNIKRNIEFMAYAKPYIRGYMLKAIYKNYSLLSRIGIHRLEQNKVDNTPLVLPMPTALDNDDGYDWRLVPLGEDTIGKREHNLDYYKLRKLYDLLFKSISPKQKRAIELYYFTYGNNGKHLTYNEVGKIMGINQNRAIELVRHGKKALKEKFGKYLDVYI